MIAGTLEANVPRPVSHFEDLYECDARARTIAGELVAQVGART